ncbi:uncharacterized protein ACWYII_046851 [Salvelinus alpinus]
MCAVFGVHPAPELPASCTPETGTARRTRCTPETGQLGGPGAPLRREQLGGPVKVPPSHLAVTVLRATGLRAKSFQGGSNPYAILQLGQRRITTPVIHDTLTPHWNCELTFPLPSSAPRDATAAALTHTIHLRRSLLALPDKFLGTVSFRLEDVVKKQDGNKGGLSSILCRARSQRSVSTWKCLSGCTEILAALHPTANLSPRPRPTPNPSPRPTPNPVPFSPTPQASPKPPTHPPTPNPSPSLTPNPSPSLTPNPSPSLLHLHEEPHQLGE